ncbi:ABC transporter substrate-binding protein [Corallococcus macrosporus]|uniref:ABC transporter substrate-binding protein n=1 Tax=Corallococcus macrosporus TaxID=35 RepID=A0ABS3DLV4_9BACT|nr:ABC transporter substrate-binding protein [Corallococcus macrosporus]MBN8232315.1 ABC transporter substrate-binding protein [Corallococcus macrosporus]
MSRPALLAALVVLAAASASAAPYRVFMVLHRSGAETDQGFKDYLHSAGLEVAFTVRNIEGDASKLPAIVQEIRTKRPDLVYAQSTLVTQGLVGQLGETDAPPRITDIPVVFAMVSDPVSAGLVERLESSGRNLTGAIHVASLPVQLKAMQSFMPLKRLGIAYNPAELSQRTMFDRLSQLTAQAGIELVAVDPLGPDGKPDAARLPTMMQRLAARRPDLVYLPPVNFFAPHSELLMSEALRLGLPTFCAIEVQLEAGGMMGLVAPFYNVGGLAGFKAAQILRDRRPPSEIPIEALSRFSFEVNMPAAHALGLYPPMHILRYARMRER